MQLSRVVASAAVAAACLGAIAPASAALADGHSTSTNRPELRSRFLLVTLENENVSNFQRRYVYCPQGWRVVGGGAEAQGPNAVLLGSFPTLDRRGWIGIGRSTVGDTVGISVYAICAR
jgi:hypothetical protein|nr:MAG: hypothetical protein DIU60_12445 [Actinomycetota bacterium]